MSSIKQLEKEIKRIKDRNKKVESDKAWETSYTRRALIFVFTYLAIGLYLQAISVPQPWLNAIVPAVAFVLSTLTMLWFKKIWIKYIFKN